jgi:hypothetical protein
MKKYLVLMGAAALVLALVSPSMAQFKSWGHLEVQTVWVTKPDFNNGGATPLNTQLLMASQSPSQGNPPAGSDLTVKQVFERFRFYLQYGDPKTVRAVLGFEADSYNFGEAPFSPAQISNGAGYTYGYNAAAGGFGRMGVVGTDQIQLKIMHAFLEFVIPTTPVKIGVGLMPFNIGGVLFLSKDVPGMTVTADFAPHKVELFWYRERDASTLSYGVDDVYGVRYSMTQKLYNVELYGFYKNDLTGNAGVNDTSAGSTNPSTLDSYYNDHPWWIGIGAGYRPGNWDLSGQWIYNGGKRDNNGVLPDQDYNAWQGILTARYRIGPGLSAAIEGFYSTGNDTSDLTKIKRFTMPISTKWGNPDEVLWGIGADRSVFYFFNWDLNYVSGHTLDYTGEYFGRLNVEYNPLAWVNLNFNWLYIGDTSSGNQATYTYNGKTVTLYPNSPNGARTDVHKDYVGQELDVIAKIKIYEPLYYNIGFGYFWPGDVFNNVNGYASADNGWALNTKLIYVF